MSNSLKRLIIVLGAIPVLLLLATFAYMVGMSWLEGSPRDFWQSLEWAAETLTTTGYGKDHTWTHPAMILLVIGVQLLGVMLVFLVVPLALVPYLERRFETKLPRRVEELSDHVVVFHYGPAVESLLEELDKAGLSTLVVEERHDEARRLLERGQQVLVVGGETDDLLSRVHIGSARALIANGTDDQNAAVIVGARQAGFEGEILAVVEEPVHRRPMMLAGATAVFTPRHVLGAALAARASERIGPTVAGIQQLGSKLRTMDVKIQPTSPLAGKTLREAGIGRTTGATVLGQWVGGELSTAPLASMVLEPDGILVIAGGSDSLAKVEELCEGARAMRGNGPFIVGGFGEVGMKVVQLLRDAGEAVCVVDRLERDGVDVVGDLLEGEVLEPLDVGNSRGVVLALDSDTATLFATVIVKDLAPHVPVIARVNQAENLDKIHRAGADFALSLSQVSGQILGRRLLGEESIAIDAQLKLLRVSSRGLEGKGPADSEIRDRTGCSIIAVERDDQLLVELEADFRFRPDDSLFVCGSKDAIRRFRELYPQD